jgi:hypothetical protein
MDKSKYKIHMISYRVCNTAVTFISKFNWRLNTLQLGELATTLHNYYTYIITIYNSLQLHILNLENSMWNVWYVANFIYFMLVYRVSNSTEETTQTSTLQLFVLIL